MRLFTTMVTDWIHCCPLDLVARIFRMTTSTEENKITVQHALLSFDRIVTMKCDLQPISGDKATIVFEDETGNPIDGEIVTAWAEVLDDYRNFQFLYVNYIGQPNSIEPPDGSNMPTKQTVTLHFRLLDRQKAAFIRVHAFVK